MPFSTTFYRWLLNEENSLSISDLAEIAPEVQATLLRLQDIVIKRDAIQSDTTFDVIEKTEKVSFFLFFIFFYFLVCFVKILDGTFSPRSSKGVS